MKHTQQTYNHPIYATADLQIIYSGTISTDVYSKFILSFMINKFAASSFSMITNYQSKITSGNRKSQGIKISAWNKGRGHLQNKMPEIKNVVNGLHPHILGISEANLLSTHDKSLVQLENYVLHTCPTITNPNIQASRMVVYTHNSLVVKLRPDLMCDGYSSVWMEVCQDAKNSLYARLTENGSS